MVSEAHGYVQADALRFAQDNTWLNDLDKEFQNLKQSGKLTIKGKELVEDKTVGSKNRWFWLSSFLFRKQVVDHFSGARYFGEHCKIPQSDHFSIAKPDSRRPCSIGYFVSLLQSLVSSGPQSAKPQETVTQFIHWATPDPDYVWPLADREPEFALFAKMVTGQSPQRILLLHGPSNTGKTACRVELIAYARRLKLPTALLDFKGSPLLDEVFEAMRVDLGEEILRTASTASGPSRFSRLIEDLQQLSKPLVLAFDTYEQSSPGAQNWLESQFLPRLDRAPSVIVVLGGQRIPEHGTYPWRALAEVRELQDIRHFGDWLEFSQRKWNCPRMKADYVQALTLATHGNPGLMSALLETLVQRLPTDLSAGTAP